jgi:hypothetical protein
MDLRYNVFHPKQILTENMNLVSQALALLHHRQTQSMRYASSEYVALSLYCSEMHQDIGFALPFAISYINDVRLRRNSDDAYEQQLLVYHQQCRQLFLESMSLRRKLYDACVTDVMAMEYVVGGDETSTSTSLSKRLLMIDTNMQCVVNYSPCVHPVADDADDRSSVSEKDHSVMLQQLLLSFQMKMINILGLDRCNRLVNPNCKMFEENDLKPEAFSNLTWFLTMIQRVRVAIDFWTRGDDNEYVEESQECVSMHIVMSEILMSFCFKYLVIAEECRPPTHLGLMGWLFGSSIGNSGMNYLYELEEKIHERFDHWSSLFYRLHRPLECIEEYLNEDEHDADEDDDMRQCSDIDEDGDEDEEESEEGNYDESEEESNADVVDDEYESNDDDEEEDSDVEVEDYYDEQDEEEGADEDEDEDAEDHDDEDEEDEEEDDDDSDDEDCSSEQECTSVSSTKESQTHQSYIVPTSEPSRVFVDNSIREVMPHKYSTVVTSHNKAMEPLHPLLLKVKLLQKQVYRINLLIFALRCCQPSPPSKDKDDDDDKEDADKNDEKKSTQEWKQANETIIRLRTMLQISEPSSDDDNNCMEQEYDDDEFSSQIMKRIGDDIFYLAFELERFITKGEPLSKDSCIESLWNHFHDAEENAEEKTSSNTTLPALDILSVYLFWIEKALEVCFMYLQIQQRNKKMKLHMIDMLKDSVEFLHVEKVLLDEGLMSASFTELHDTMVTIFSSYAYEGKSSMEWVSSVYGPKNTTRPPPAGVTLMKSFEEDKRKIHHVLRQATKYWQESHVERELDKESKEMKMLSSNVEESLFGIDFVRLC